MQTTLYNHKNIENNGRPLIPNVIYKSLFILLDHKDIEACEYILECYTLTQYQLHVFESQKNKLSLVK